VEEGIDDVATPKIHGGRPVEKVFKVGSIKNPYISVLVDVGIVVRCIVICVENPDIVNRT
jgi:hypothetical protein